jgi:LacI family transcriptional regulator
MAIGHVIPVSSKNEMLNPIFAEFIAGASETYTKHNYEIILSIVRDEDENKIYHDLKSKKSVDGVIVHAPQKTDSRIDLLKKLELPFVVHGRVSGPNTGHSWIDVTNLRAFKRATKFLIDLGHTRISLINGIESMNFASQRRKGFISAMEEHKLSFDPELMKSDALTEFYGYTSARLLLSKSNAPTAFLVSSYIVATGVRRAVIELGLVLGRDISIVTHDDELSYFSNVEDIPQFTATRSSVREAGRRAAVMLLDIIENPNQPPRNELLKAELIVGLSTGPNVE